MLKQNKSKALWNATVLIFVIAIFFPFNVHASDTELCGSVSNAGIISGMACNNGNFSYPLVGTVYIVKGTAPSGTVLDSFSLTSASSWFWANGIGIFDPVNPTAGNYHMVVSLTNGTNHYFCVNTPNGTSGFTKIDCGLPFGPPFVPCFDRLGDVSGFCDLEPNNIALATSTNIVVGGIFSSNPFDGLTSYRNQICAEFINAEQSYTLAWRPCWPITASGDNVFSTTTNAFHGTYGYFIGTFYTSNSNDPSTARGNAVNVEFLVVASTQEQAQIYYNSFQNNQSVNTFLENCETIMSSSTAPILDKGICVVPYTFNSIIRFLFIPNPILTQNFIVSFKDNMLTRFPMGYVTDFVAIVSTSSTSTMPVLSFTTPTVFFGGGASLTLDTYRVLDPILYATSSNWGNSTSTLYATTSYYWDIMIYLLALLYILGRIIGFHVIPRNIFVEKGAIDDNYRLKEYLYNHKNK